MSFLAKAFYIDDILKDKRCNRFQMPNVTEINDLVYDESLPDCCRLDLFFDKAQQGKFTKNKFPVLFNIHGGGWIIGDKSFRRGFALTLANDGFLVININYGLGPKYLFPDYMKQIFAALDWLCCHGDEYGCDLDNLFVTGDSAGAHLSLCTVNALENPELRSHLKLPELNLKIKGVIPICGPYDFEAFWMQFPIMNTMTRHATGVKHARDVKTYEYKRELNPLNDVSNKFPPSLIITGAQDFVTKGDNKKLKILLDEKHVSYQEFQAKNVFNCFHCFHLRVYLPEAKRALAKIRDFIVANLSVDAEN